MYTVASYLAHFGGTHIGCRATSPGTWIFSTRFLSAIGRQVGTTGDFVKTEGKLDFMEPPVGFEPTTC
jgi:hypothetical protein